MESKVTINNNANYFPVNILCLQKHVTKIKLYGKTLLPCFHGYSHFEFNFFPVLFISQTDNFADSSLKLTLYYSPSIIYNFCMFLLCLETKTLMLLHLSNSNETTLSDAKPSTKKSSKLINNNIGKNRKLYIVSSV